jgi:hypothetical protein
MHPEIKITARCYTRNDYIRHSKKNRIEIIKFLPFFINLFWFINTLELKTLIDDQFIS